MNKPEFRVSRRTFMLAAGAGTAVTAAAIVGKKEPEPHASQDPSPKKSMGYQVTEHVRNYYRTAKI